MKELFYNPCIEGFEAKCWECLRRNTKFEDDIYWDYPQCLSEALEYAPSWLSNYDKNHSFHNVVFVHVIGHDPEDRWAGMDSPMPRMNLSQTWQEIDPRIKNEINYSIYGDGVFPLEKTPTRDELVECIANNKSKLITRFLYELDSTLKTHVLVAIPKWVSDNSHKKLLLNDLAKIIGEPKGETKWFKPTGRTLGTKSDWRAFLLIEDWMKKNYDYKDACHLAVWEIYDKVKFGVDFKDRNRIAKKLLRERSRKHKQITKIYRAFDRIKTAIDSIYPNFECM
jgi:hypothetical protein